MVTSEAWNACAVPWNCPTRVGGAPRLAFAAGMASTAGLRDVPRAKIEGKRYGGEDALVVDGQRLDRARHMLRAQPVLSGASRNRDVGLSATKRRQD